MARHQSKRETPYEPPCVMRLDASFSAAGQCKPGSGDHECETGYMAPGSCSTGLDLA
jgi:hypothetical protein